MFIVNTEISDFRLKTLSWKYEHNLRHFVDKCVRLLASFSSEKLKSLVLHFLHAFLEKQMRY